MPGAIRFDRRTAMLATGAVMGAAVLAHTTPRAAEPGVPPFDRELHVPVEGGRIYVRVNGNLAGPRPPLLLVHGGPGGALWQMFPALPLASDRAVILYDQLDSGRSDAPGDPANWTVERFVSEIDAIRAALGVTRLHLLGHSWGGIVAHRYAATQPAGLLSLTLQGAPLSARAGHESISGLVAALPDGAAAAVAAAETSGDFSTSAYADAEMAFMQRHLFRTGLRDVAMPYMADTPPDRGDALATAMTGNRLLGGFGGVLQGFDDEALASRVSVPVLLLCGELDIMTPAATRAMLPLFGRASVQEIAGAGHMAQFDQPDAWRAAVGSFIAAQDA